ncbi:sulfite:cytochrome C oxidoreductase subunit B [Sulfurimonas sp.]
MKKLLLIAILSTSALFAQVKGDIEVPYISYPIKMGKGFNTVQADCLMCHSFGYIINQGPQSRKFWSKKVEKMITHFKAPISKKDTKVIVNYLFENYGNGKLK